MPSSKWSAFALPGLAILALAFPLGLLVYDGLRQKPVVISQRITNNVVTIQLDRTGDATIQEEITHTLPSETHAGTARRLPSKTLLLVERLENTESVRLRVTDTPRTVAIDTVRVDIHGPVVPASARCYIGAGEGRQTYPCRSETRNLTTTFTNIRWIDPGEDLFIELDYPVGTFSAPFVRQSTPRIPVWLLIVLTHAAFAGLLWFVHGRDDRGRGTIVPSEEALDDIKPYEAGALLAQGPTYAGFVGMLLDLVERGAVTLARLEGDGYLTFSLERGNRNVALNPLETIVLNRLFQYPFPSDSSTEEAGVASIGRESLQAKLAYGIFSKLVHEQLIARGWYSRKVNVVHLSSAGILVGWTAGLYLLLEGLVNDPWLHLMFLQIPMFLPIIYVLPHLTTAGALAREHVRGLAWYLRVAEKDRLAFHENPQQLHLKPGKQLAYAVAMKIDTHWERHFSAGYEKVKKTR